MNNIIVIELKTLARQRGIKGYYKLRTAELIRKLEAHRDLIVPFLIPCLEISRNTTRLVSTSAIPDDPNMDL